MRHRNGLSAGRVALTAIAIAAFATGHFPIGVCILLIMLIV